VIPNRIPPELFAELSSALAQDGAPLKKSAVYERIASTAAEYSRTITRVEAAFVLAGRSQVNIRPYLEQAGLDRVRTLLLETPRQRDLSMRAESPARAKEREAEPRRAAEECRKRPIDVLDCCALHVEVMRVSRQLFRNGHYARAVEEAFKLFNNAVKNKAGRPKGTRGDELDGASLMTHVFSPNAPILKINPLRSTSQQNEQQGYMQLAAGAMVGLRNPRAHDHELKDDPAQARELLHLASYLLRRVDGATRARSKRKP
jgi:uncharacterized protein (TIGR02391 family)